MRITYVSVEDVAMDSPIESVLESASIEDSTLSFCAARRAKYAADDTPLIFLFSSLSTLSFFFFFFLYPSGPVRGTEKKVSDGLVIGIFGPNVTGDR